MVAGPQITVCITTHDRPELASRALRSVLEQEGPALAAVVVNNGPEVHTGELRTRHPDPRVEVATIPDRGLCASRNEGLARVRTPWVAFLDDDDRLLPTWSAIMTDHTRPGVGLASCSVDVVTVDGTLRSRRPATAPVDQLDGVVGLHLPGCFVVRTDVAVDAGGYLPGLACSHQTELWIRLVAEVRRRGLRTEADPRVGAAVTHRPLTERALMDPQLMLEGCRWLAVRHRDHFAGLPRARADLLSVAAVNAARLERWGWARRTAAGAVAADPWSVRRWARLGATALPAVARRAWAGAGAFEASRRAANDLSLVRRLADEHPERRDDLLFLPWGYRANPPRSSDADGDGYWAGGVGSSDVRFQDPVYRWAARLVARGTAHPPVLDVGCGWGWKLVHRVGRVTSDHVGVDQASGIGLARDRFPAARWIEGDLADDATWEHLGEVGARLVICADVIEHVPDPYALLDRIRGLLGDGAMALISTPDRRRLEGNDPLGPPRNPRHVREWSADELALLLEAAGLQVRARRRLLPRSYAPSVLEAKRQVHRLLHRRVVPDRRSSLAYLVTAEEGV